ncbi:hypothetical protein FRC17_003508 [Serendipita sp. 399]|nr:hypothetical protein FRC17_003508 [Serendipita sp. 399]
MSRTAPAPQSPNGRGYAVQTALNNPLNDLRLCYESQGIRRSTTLDWRPVTFNELLEFARKTFPIPPSVGFVATNSGCDGKILTSSIWQSKRLEIRTVDIFPLALGPPDDSDYDFPIIIKTLTGKEYPIVVNSAHTVTRIMLEIQRIDGLPFGYSRLIWNSRQLSPGESIAEYGIRENDIITCVVRLRGGKPVIYLFSPHSREVQVSLSLVPSWSFSALYPVKAVKESDQGEAVDWKVVTQPDGTLVDTETGLEVAYLYWEALTIPSYHAKTVTPPSSRPSSPHSVSTIEVFEPSQPVLDPENSVLFSIGRVPKYLDEVLLALGLHTEARTSFITYWLPDMMKYPNIALRFLPQAAYEPAAPLNVQPSPTTATRVFMLWCGVDTSEASEDGRWAEAILRGKTMEVTKWREIVGTSGNILKDEKDDLRLLEWGGMEVNRILGGHNFHIPPTKKPATFDQGASRYSTTKMAHIPQSDDHAPAVQAAATTNTESTKALILYYESQGIESSMTINWRPTNVNDLLELAQNAFPIPPFVAFVAVDVGCSWPILTPRIWQSRRLEIEKVNIIPLAVGYPIESGYRFPITIKSLTGRDYIITVNSMHTVASVMLEIEAVEGIPFDEIRLLYKGRPLSFENRSSRMAFKKTILSISFSNFVSLSLAPSWSFSAVYPIKGVKKSNQGETVNWKVVTQADGMLLDSETGSDVAYLYWEALTNPSYRVKEVTPPSSRPCSPHPASTVEVFEPSQPVLDPGNAVLFPIGNIPKYLDKVLLALGLHTEARTSFITYWLPDMMKYPSIALRFLPQAAYEKAAPLNVQPSPTMTTRVFMLWCGVDTSEASEGGQWAEAIVRGKTMELTKWREVVGTSGAILKDGMDDLRVLEWGGMEIK